MALGVWFFKIWTHSFWIDKKFSLRYISIVYFLFRGHLCAATMLLLFMWLTKLRGLSWEMHLLMKHFLSETVTVKHFSMLILVIVDICHCEAGSLFWTSFSLTLSGSLLICPFSRLLWMMWSKQTECNLARPWNMSRSSWTRTWKSPQITWCFCFQINWFSIITLQLPHTDWAPTGTKIL